MGKRKRKKNIEAATKDGIGQEKYMQYTCAQTRIEDHEDARARIDGDEYMCRMI